MPFGFRGELGLGRIPTIANVSQIIMFFCVYIPKFGKFVGNQTILKGAQMRCWRYGVSDLELVRDKDIIHIIPMYKFYMTNMQA